MPSEDPINEKANEWMRREAPIYQGAAAAVPRAKPKPRKMAAAVLRLALRLGKDPDEIASNIPEDTMRRLQYPVMESVTPDGKRVYEHDLGISHDRARSTRG